MWQKELKKPVIHAKELAKYLHLPVIADPKLKKWGLKAPWSWIRRIKPRDLHDPLLRQVLPITDELQRMPGFTYDPLQEKKFTVMPGMLHKYHGRVLLLIADNCALNCRFCFRRHYRGEGLNWQQALQYIASDETIFEVILSGGDPLLLSDAALKKYMHKIAAIKHVKYLRIHSRLPIVVPSRITRKLLQVLTSTRLEPIIVVHCNHAQEINAEVKNKLLQIKKAGITLLNQTVLLHKINDNAQVLITLSQALFAAGVLPYYLHFLDQVQGAQHFYVNPLKAKNIHAKMMKELPGYLVPKLAREIPNAVAKAAIT